MIPAEVSVAEGAASEVAGCKPHCVMRHSSVSGTSHSENPDGWRGEEGRRGGPAAVTWMPHGGQSWDLPRSLTLLEVPQQSPERSLEECPPVSVSGVRAKETPTNPLSHF